MNANAVATRMPALAPISSRDIFLSAMTEPLNAQALDLIDELANKGAAATDREWRLAAVALPWDHVSSVIWRCIALMTYNNPLGQGAFQAALVRNAIYFEDFHWMADSWENVDFVSTGMVLRKVREVAVYLRAKSQGEILIARIANSGRVSYEAQRWWWAG